MRVHLIVQMLIVGLVPILLFHYGFLETYTDIAIQSKISDIKKQSSILATRLDLLGYISNPTADDINNELNYLTEVYKGKTVNARILIVNENLLVIKDTYDSETYKVLISEPVIKCFKGQNSQIINKREQYVEFTQGVTNSDKQVIGALIIRFSIEDIYAIQANLRERMIIITLIIAILIFLISFYYSKKMTKPLLTLTSSMDRLFEGYMEDEIEIKGYLESEKISQSFNKMIGRLKKQETSRQEFVSNVSHELKTPITSIKVLAESLLTQEDAPAELYREFLVDINDEIERENKIINDLLSLVKLDRTEGVMHINSININDLLEQILKRLRPIAQKRNIEMVFESFRPVIAEVDEVKLSLAISNLIENAIKYNKDDGWIRVSLNADHKYFYVKVADSGVGIPEDSKDLIFERFYRVDKARSRETGGTGLGLAIARNSIHMHRGAIKVYSQINEGTTFTVRIPLNYIA